MDTAPLREALERLDSRGRFLRSDLASLKAWVSEVREGQVPLDHPADLFGPWSELGPRAKAALREAVERDIRRTMDLFPHGAVWTSLVRGGWELDRFLHERRMAPRLRRPLIRSINRLSGGPLHARRMASDLYRRRRWESGGQAGVADLLGVLDRSPQWLLGDFVEAVEVDRRARGHHVEPARNVTFSYHVGLDFLPTREGLCCLEANLEPGIHDRRLEVREGTPISDAVLRAAQALRARRVLWLEGHRLPLRTWLLEALTRRAREEGVLLEVFEHPCMPRRRPLPTGLEIPNRWRLAMEIPNDTLVVRRNEFPVGPDYLVSHKEAFVRGVRRALAERNEKRVYVAPMTRVPHEVPEPDGPALPNLVYKYPDSLAALGVFFLKARDTEHALAMARELDRERGEPPGLFQRFVASSLPDGRRVYGARAEILLSPRGVWFVEGFLRVGAQPLPEELPFGYTEATGVFAADIRQGGARFERLEGPLKEEVVAAGIAVGEALRDALGRTFRTVPEGW